MGLLSAVSLNCEENKKTTAAPPAASPLVSAKPAPSAPAEPPKEVPKPAPKPKKSAADCPKVQTVTFPSTEVEDAVRLKLSKKTGDITRAELAKVRSLNISLVTWRT